MASDQDEKWGTRGRIAAALLPIIPAAPFWTQLKDNFGPEGAVLVIVVSQLILAVWLPDVLVEFAAKRRARSGGKPRVSSQKIYENSKFRYELTPGFGTEHEVYDKAQATFRFAAEATITQLEAMLATAYALDWPTDLIRQKAICKIYIAFCITVHHPESEIAQTFNFQPADIAAVTFGMMPE